MPYLGIHFRIPIARLPLRKSIGGFSLWGANRKVEIAITLPLSDSVEWGPKIWGVLLEAFSAGQYEIGNAPQSRCQEQNMDTTTGTRRTGQSGWKEMHSTLVHLTTTVQV